MVTLYIAQPLEWHEGSKKGSNKGIDGVIPFIDDATAQPKRVLIQVKSGHVKSGDIRDLKGTMQREEAPIGIFITLEEPSKDMITEAVSAGYYYSPVWKRDYPRLQILTIDELMHGARVQMPSEYMTFKQAQRVQRDKPEEPTLF